MTCVMILSLNGTTGACSLTKCSVDRLWKSHRSRRSEPEFRAWLPQETRLCSEKERRSPPEPSGRSCTPWAWLSEKRPSHWQDNCNEQIHHRPCSETTRLGASSCPDTNLLGILCIIAVQWEASSAPSHRPLFEYSWGGSIAGRPKKKQASEHTLENLHQSEVLSGGFRLADAGETSKDCTP